MDGGVDSSTEPQTESESQSQTDSRLLLLTRPLPGNDEGYEEI